MSKEMTVKAISKELGYEIKLVKEQSFVERAVQEAQIRKGWCEHIQLFVEKEIGADLLDEEVKVVLDIRSDRGHIPQFSVYHTYKETGYYIRPIFNLPIDYSECYTKIMLEWVEWNLGIAIRDWKDRKSCHERYRR